MNRVSIIYAYVCYYFIRVSRIHVNFIKVSRLTPVLKDQMVVYIVTRSFLSLMFLDCRNHKTPFGTNATDLATDLAITRVSSVNIPVGGTKLYLLVGTVPRDDC